MPSWSAGSVTDAQSKGLTSSKGTLIQPSSIELDVPRESDAARSRRRRNVVLLLGPLFLVLVGVVAGVVGWRLANPESPVAEPTVAFLGSGEGVTAEVLSKRTDWREEGQVDSSAMLSAVFIIVPKTSHESTLELLTNISTPGHPMQHQFLSAEQLSATISNPWHTAVVRSWLEHGGVTVTSEGPHGLHLSCTASAATWEALLSLTFGRFVPVGGRRRRLTASGRPHAVLRSRGPPQVPAHIAVSVESIHGLSHLPPRMIAHGPRARSARSSRLFAAPQSGGRRLTAAWVEAEGCPVNPCAPPADAGRRRMQSWDGSGQAQHICCHGAGDDGRRRLQSWDGSGQVDCDSGHGRQLGSEGTVEADPLASSNGQAGACVNHTAVNSTTLGLLREAYNISRDLGDPAISMWFLTPLMASHSPSDLHMFQSLYGVPVENITVGCADGGKWCEHTGGLESNLDAQYLSSVAPRATVVEEQFDPWDSEDSCVGPECWLADALECVDYQCEESGYDCSSDPCYGKPPPDVISISWGVPEEDLPQQQILGFNAQAAYLALLGTTIVAAAGDGGAAGIYQAPSDDDDDSQQHVPICGSTYQTLFPASSPFVTSVGATQGIENGQSQQACSASTGGGITSGGGFSQTQYHKEIPWPLDYVKDYLTSASGKTAATGYFKFTKYQDSYDDDHSGAYVTTGRIDRYRAYPDLALAGSAVQMVNKGKVVLVDGTSASAPIFAAMVAGVVADRKVQGLNVNDAAATHNTYAHGSYSSWKATKGYRLGWLNPILYANAHAFDDITVGSNTDGRGISCAAKTPQYYHSLSYGEGEKFLSKAAGFEASVGWDPVSGLGSIDYPSLRALFPKRVATSADSGNLGSDYYTNYEGENDAISESRFSPPTPPSSYYYG